MRNKGEVQERGEITTTSTNTSLGKKISYNRKRCVCVCVCTSWRVSTNLMATLYTSVAVYLSHPSHCSLNKQVHWRWWGEIVVHFASDLRYTFHIQPDDRVYLTIS